ncbi:hypothetical protein [Aeromicrobium sp.]|uniref:hypothetical protein n=1 Tax=Aeromicrobium sp. TaxID=1871063 RepID=UPI0028AA36B1|nr:hypothetical protein [Aeromicrobium sp.]
MLRLLPATLVTVITFLLLAAAAHAAHGDRPGAGSAADYEFLGGTGAETIALAAPHRTDQECDLHAPYDDSCVGASACWVNDPAAVQDPRRLAGVPRPRRGDHVAFRSCVTASGDQWSRWYWSSGRGSATD